MSAYGEYKAGFITAHEYYSIMREEELRDRDYLLGEEYSEDEDEYFDDDEMEGE